MKLFNGNNTKRIRQCNFEREYFIKKQVFMRDPHHSRLLMNEHGENYGCQRIQGQFTMLRKDKRTI